MIKDYYEARGWLEKYIPQTYTKKNLGLARIRNLLKLLGNPQDKFKSILIAGTSGKGSTAFYTARLLQKVASRQRPETRIGLHVSPHLSYIGERMQINGKPIEVKKLIKLIELIRLKVESMAKTKVGLPSYFEILVAASFKYFADEKVDWAVVEVGLGGRLDATNVLSQELSVITNIGLDHTDILGNTVEQIAFEKAGIIKNEKGKMKKEKVITAATGKALEVIKKVAKEKKAELITKSTPNAMEDYLIIYSDILNDRKVYISKDVFWCTLATVSSLGFKLPKAKIVEVFSSPFPGRFEKVSGSVVLDGAHNLDKVKALINFLKKFTVHPFDKLRASGSRFTVVCAFKKGKHWEKMLDYLTANLDIQRYIITQFYTPTDTGFFSSVEPNEIKSYIESKSPESRVKVFENSYEAVFEAIGHQALGTRHQQLILVTGSMYLVGEARTIWHLPQF